MSLRWVKKQHLLFVGERRSPTAVRMGVTWEDGRLAAKQLFDAFDAIGFERWRAEFCNLFEDGGRAQVISALLCGKPIVAMGQKVHDELTLWCILHHEIVHPAARGAIRNKRRYADHVRRQLKVYL